MKEINYDFTYDESIVSYVQAKAKKENGMGARPILRVIQNDIEDKVTELMLERDYEPNYSFSACSVEDKVHIQ